MYLIEGLEQIPARERTFAGTLGGPFEKEILDRFLDKVRARPQDYKGLLLNARLHPFPHFSLAILNYPVEKWPLVELILFAGTTNELVLKELYKIADAKLQQEIEAERKLWEKMLEALKKADKSKLKLTRWFVQAALLDRKRVVVPNGDGGYAYVQYPRIGSDFAKSFSGSVGQEIFNSNASEAHLVNLGLGLARHAIDLLGTDVAFKKDVEKERKKQVRKAKQADDERKREEKRRKQRRRRGR